MHSTWLSRRFVLLAALIVCTVACELLVGIGDAPHLAANPVSDGGGDDAEAGAAVCNLPTVGDAQVRITNLVPTTDRYDFCLTRTDGQSPPTSGVLAASGKACPQGLLYRQMLAPYAVPSGAYRVDAVAPGSACTSTPVATLPNANFDAATITTLALFGTNAGTQLQLKAFREEKGKAVEPKVRFINAWSDGPASLEYGVAIADELPTTLLGAQIFVPNATYTNIAPAAGKIDALGYFSSLAGFSVPFGFAETGKGTTAAAAARYQVFGNLSTFAIGTTADPRFPLDLMICNQDINDGIFTRCSNTLAKDVIVDVYNTQLQGRFVPAEPDRRPAIQKAIAGLDGDFACITEVWDEADKQAIIAAAKNHFPFAATFKTDFTTVPNDPRDQMGTIPPAYTAPPCDTSGTTAAQDALACLADHCSTKAPGDLTGQLPDSAAGQCIAANCIGAFAPLFSDLSCYECVITQVESGVSFADTKTRCSTDPKARYAFDGGIGILMLSTRQFINSGTNVDAGAPDGGADGGAPPPSDNGPALIVFPSSEYRAAAIRVPVDLGAGSAVSSKLDVYCAILTTPATSAQRPYTGQYGGNGADSTAQWLNENILQAKQLNAYVQATSQSRKRRAIIAGDFYSGPALGDLQALNQPAYDTLVKVLPLAIAPDYTPACTFCGDNPLVSAGGPPLSTKLWSSYALLSDIAQTEVQDNTVIVKELTAKTNTNPLVPDAGVSPVPPSAYYGMRTTIRVRP